MDIHWVVNSASKSNQIAQVIVVKSNSAYESNQSDSISMEVPDLDFVYDKAVSMGIEITYPRTKEPWGVERFFVEEQNGITINLMRHA